MNAQRLPNKLEYNALPTLERLPLVHEALVLDGSRSTNRAPLADLQENITNDYEAVLYWLREYGIKSHTYRAYRKEVERLLLWCIYQIKKPLSWVP